MAPPKQLRPRDRPIGSPAKSRAGWSIAEDFQILRGLKERKQWIDISKELPGRTATACRMRYKTYLKHETVWYNRKQTELAEEYEKLKPDLWDPVANELDIPWQRCEAIHWAIGENERRANIIPFAVEWDKEKQTELTRVYKRLKPDLWNPIANKLGIPWHVCEAMHWVIGEYERQANTIPFAIQSPESSIRNDGRKKRQRLDSTTSIGSWVLPKTLKNPGPEDAEQVYEEGQILFERNPNLYPAAAASNKRPRPEEEDPIDAPANASKWSAAEIAKMLGLRGSGKTWEDIANELPGRNACSCKTYYYRHLNTKWDEDKQTRLETLYERHKDELWNPIAAILGIPSPTCEAMHWVIGQNDMAHEPNAIPFAIAAADPEPREPGQVAQSDRTRESTQVSEGRDLTPFRSPSVDGCAHEPGTPGRLALTPSFSMCEEDDNQGGKDNKGEEEEDKEEDKEEDEEEDKEEDEEEDEEEDDCLAKRARIVPSTDSPLPEFIDRCDNYGCNSFHSHFDCPLEKKCWGCRSKNHFTSDCPMTCTICCSEGHIRKYCDDFEIDPYTGIARPQWSFKPGSSANTIENRTQHSQGFERAVYPTPTPTSQYASTPLQQPPAQYTSISKSTVDEFMSAKMKAFEEEESFKQKRHKAEMARKVEKQTLEYEHELRIVELRMLKQG